MVCKVKMGSYPNFTDGVQWTISGNGDHGMEHNDALESWEITGCENSSVVFYEHGDHNQRQQAHALTNGKYQRYNESKWINTHGPYASPLNGISAAKIQSPGGESLTKGGKINAIIDIPDGQGPRAQESSTVDNWDNYLKPNQDHGLSNHCPGATWKAWQHAKTADKPAKALCQWKIEEDNMASLAASDKTHVKGKYNTIINRVCNAIKNDHPNFKTGRANNETCWDLVNTQDFMKDYCFKENRMSENSLCSKSSLGNSYGILAEEYCLSNPDKEFCKCYNVVNYETVCANRPTSKGCAVAKTKLDSIKEKLGVENATDALPCGTVCAGANVYKPDGFKSGCDITYNACIQSIDVGESNAEINAVCDIDSTSGLTDGESGGSSGSSGSGGSGGSGSVSTSAVEELKKTIAEKEEKEEEEAKKTNKKLLIGGGGGGIVSSISCIILMVIIVIVMSKKGGGGRRRR